METIKLPAGVWVVEDYDRPVFYDDGWYWWYSDGVWLRSRSHTDGFVRVRASIVPRALIRIESPRRYAHYKARAGARVRTGPPAHANNDKDSNRVRVRDHRDRGKHKGHHKHRGH